MQNELFEYKSQGKGTPQAKAEKYLVEPAWLRYETEKGLRAVKKILAIWVKRFKQLVTASILAVLDQAEMITLLKIVKAFLQFDSGIESEACLCEQIEGWDRQANQQN